tara:strand:+ start:245 stop:535 length:291 start_codon:yes stop_codon:yes gene_type:complete
MKKLFKKTTIYVVRCDKNNKFQESAPCNRCLETIILLNIKRIVFSSINNTFVSTTPQNLKINHTSSGSRHITKTLKYIENIENIENKENKENIKKN